MSSFSWVPRTVSPMQNAYHRHLLSVRRPRPPRDAGASESLRKRRTPDDERRDSANSSPKIKLNPMRPFSSFGRGSAPLRLAILAGFVFAVSYVPLRGQGPPVLVPAEPHEEYYL